MKTKGLFSKLGQKIRSVFRGRPKMPKVPRRMTEGHRGIAAGKLPSFAGEQQAQKVDVKIGSEQTVLNQLKLSNASQTEINKQIDKVEKLKQRAWKLRNPQKFTESGGTAAWHTIGGDEVSAFVYDASPLFVHSTNIAFAQYFIEDSKLMIEFLGGGKYLFSNVSEAEAFEFAKAPSKGGWHWDTIRVRGKGNAKKTRKPFVKLG